MMHILIDDPGIYLVYLVYDKNVGKNVQEKFQFCNI